MTNVKRHVQETLIEAMNNTERMTDAIELFTPLIKQNQFSISKFYEDFEDANQDVLCAFIEVIKNPLFNQIIRKNYIQGLAYLKKAMNNKVINLINKQTKNKEIPLSSFLQEGKEEYLDLYDNVFVEKECFTEMLKLEEYNLSQNEVKILSEYYFYGKKIYEIADELKIYPESVSRIKKRALKKLRKEN